ncbi:hypothetical protein P3T23_004690 [Paraburkholderia sp. GAS448]
MTRRMTIGWCKASSGHLGTEDRKDGEVGTNLLIASAK